MTWRASSLSELQDLVSAAEPRMDAEVHRFWEAVRIVPQKWAQHPHGDEGGGFWAVGVIGSRVIWYNDIEDGFNESRYEVSGEIAEYGCDQHGLETALWNLLRRLEAEGVWPGGAAEVR